MSITIIYHPELHIIENRMLGDFRMNEAKELLSKEAQAIKEHNCFLILTDMTDAILKFSTVELYEFPKVLAYILDSSGVEFYKLKRALVVEKDLEDYKFFETVTVNRGQRVRLFFDIDEAKKWLSEK